MKAPRLALFALLLFGRSAGAAPAASAESALQAFNTANEHFRKGEYVQAAGAYEAALAASGASGALHYDAANAWQKAGELGRAIGHYRAAERLTPRDEDLAANLEQARRRVADRIEPPRPSPALRTAFFWVYVLSSRELLLGTAAALGLALALLGLRFSGRAWALGPALGALGLALALGGGLAGRALGQPALGVVVPAEASVRAGPEPGATTLFHLHAGTELEVQGDEGDWQKIRLSDGKRGWLRLDELFLVR